jgi:exonuclease SbcD
MQPQKEPAALVVNDVHLHLTTLETGKDVLAQAVALCTDLGIKYLILNGDLFTERKGQPLEVLLAALWFKQLCFDTGLTVLAIPGNHDKTDQESEDSFLDLFHGGDFHVFRKESVVLLKGAAGTTLRVWLLPYFSENGSLPERLNNLVHQLCDQKDDDQRNEGLVDDGWHINQNVLCMHAAVSGVRNNDGSEVKNNLTTQLFNLFTSVVVGHYHNYSRLGENIHYTGSAYPRNHGEDNDKGFTIVYVDGSLKRVKAVFPEYNSYELSPAELTPEMIQSLRIEKESVSNNLRVIVRATKAELKSYDLAPLLNLGIEAKKKPLELDEAIEAAAENRVESHTVQTLHEQFNHFATSSGYSDELTEEGRNILSKLK